MTSTSTPSTFSGKAVWGFVVFSHGWTWFFWMVAALFGATIWRPPALIFFIIGGLGVLLGGVVMTRLMRGADGLRDLSRRIIDPRRITGRWWAVVLLFFPLLTLLAGTLSRALGDAQPFDFAGVVQRLANPAGLLAMIAFTFFIGPFPEEIGWRGYLLDHLQTRWSALAAGLVVGLLNWIWHYPLFYLPGYADAFHAIPPSMLQMFFVVVPAVLLYTWTYNNTGRSILATMLFHFSGNFWGEFFGLSAQGQTIRIVLVIVAVAIIAWWWGPATLRRVSEPAAAA
jgi:membrane protease YdiL (CAAX protease family)